MAHFFHANEIAKVAVEIERKGRQFYNRAADAAQSEETKDLFRYLAEEETKHEEIFSALLERLGSVELPAWSNEEEYTTYLNALIDSHALFSGGLAEKYMADAADEDTAIRMAMSFEKDTLLFFLEMKELVPESEKDAVQQCADEERNHLRQLKERLNS
ncbi:ferritin-like domain-containing protein [Pseudodesulfovibrio sediminis]|uniref:Rubrerythrin n=1 Tax=Pseudodesulfovibrio sediminis TaxID=2810563 RepID=A0ABN6EWD1_9BACT|nr:ferritin family protein [Pseudodesulfovibrio sediminis]BCS89775.1 rubrerythrin [Pseudodesulfovibrio sediminis]